MTEKNTELIILTPSGLAMPALIAAAERAFRRFVEFFTANIRNKNTRGPTAANIAAFAAFLAWCDVEAGHDSRHDRTNCRRHLCQEITQRRTGRDPDTV